MISPNLDLSSVFSLSDCRLKARYDIVGIVLHDLENRYSSGSFSLRLLLKNVKKSTKWTCQVLVASIQQQQKIINGVRFICHKQKKKFYCVSLNLDVTFGSTAVRWLSFIVKLRDYIIQKGRGIEIDEREKKKLRVI